MTQRRQVAVPVDGERLDAVERRLARPARDRHVVAGAPGLRRHVEPEETAAAEHEQSHPRGYPDPAP